MIYKNYNTDRGYKQFNSQYEFDEILDLFAAKANFQPRISGSGYIIRCTVHNDRNPSLFIRQRGDGKTCITCFAGCSIYDICASVGLNVKDLYTCNHQE